MAASSLFEVPRPKTFLYAMSLRTGVELIVLTILVNKITGFYGILALATGYHVSPLQLSMYIYSIVALFLTVYLAQYIRKQDPLRCLALAWFYAIDTVINAAYTAAFGVAWFLVLAQHPHETKPDGAAGGPGGKMIGDTSGFTSPKYNVSEVGVVAEPASGYKTGQDAVAVGSTDGFPAAGLGGAVFQSGSITSISIISTLWAVRIYFVVIMLAYARSILRQHIMMTSASQYTVHTGSPSDSMAENPFGENREEGQGWQGKLGRFMVSFGKEYWLGRDEDGEWMRGMGGKFRKSTSLEPPPGVHERERRRRSGTGPPAPPPQLPRISGPDTPRENGQ
ncbi:Inositolphosphorylceramide synthase subunit Kei1-domain-containing protein [Phyllosticta capitalensis]